MDRVGGYNHFTERDNIQQTDPTAKSGDLIMADGRICSSAMPGIASSSRGLLSVLTKANHTCTALGEKAGPRLRE